MANVLEETSRAREKKAAQDKVRVHVFIPRPTQDALDVLALQVGLKRSGLINVALSDLLNKYGKQAKV